MKIFKTYYELTFTGFVFAGVLCFVLIAAVNSQTNVLFWTLGIILGAIIVSGVMGNLLLRRLEVARMVGDHAVVGQPAEVHYRLLNNKKIWPSCAIRVTEARFSGKLRTVPEGYCLHLGPRHNTLVLTHLISETRGELELRELRVCCSFPFGFVNRAIHYLSPHKIIVYPRIGFLNQQLLARTRTFSTTGTITSQARGGADEFFGLREYQPGDSIRSIHWRSSARTGRMVVREMTSDTPPTMIVVLDIRPWADVSDGRMQSERAIELAASLICHGIQDNFAVGLLIAGSPVAAPRAISSGRTHRDQLLEALALINIDKIDSTPHGIAQNPPEALRNAAEYVIAGLSSKCNSLDLVPPGSTYTLLPMDDPHSDQWLHFPEKPPVEAPPSQLAESLA